MMKILYMNWKSYAGEDLLEAFSHLKDRTGNPVEVMAYPFENTEKRTDPAFEERFTAALKKEKPDAVCSFNYYPLISSVCGRENVPYLSIVYDSPHISLYSYTTLNPCNHIYVFDSAVAEEFHRQGIPTVHYLPLAVNVQRMDAMRSRIEPAENAGTGAVQKDASTIHDRFDADVAFVGSLYTEDHTFYDRMEPKLDDYTRGYLKGVIDSQLLVDGVNFVQKCLTPPIVERMMQAYPMEPNPDGVETSAWIYAQYMINRKVTQIERTRLLTAIGERFGGDCTVALYTRDASFRAAGIANRGRIDYYNDMPFAFKCAKINLNITLRSIHKGIPLRAFDIMGAGGFLLTNYQPDFLLHFVPGEDFVYYESDEDLLSKIDYYLTHEEERAAIAQSGHEKVVRYHSWEKRLQQILEDALGVKVDIIE